MVTTVAASSTLRYNNDPQINSTTSWAWFKTQTITITSDITGTIRVTYNFGANTGCYGSPYGCVSTQITKNGVAIFGTSPDEGIESVDTAIATTLLANDKLELWVLETDCGGPGCTFPAYTSYFRVYYDPSAGASFTSTPSGAEIWIDGVDKGVTTPNTIVGLTAGSHTYKLTLSGYQDATGSFSTTIGSTTTVPNVTMTPGTGNASFTSNPSGATIWIDGINKGVITPNTITNLSVGSHNYTLKLTGYNDATGSFSVTSGSTTTVPTVTLTASTGSASFTSNPTGATIWIDGVNQGVITPNTIANLSAGSHNYTLKLTGYADATGSFSVTGGSTTTVPTVTFAPSLYITSSPSGARIWIDGLDQGVITPNTITNLSIGSHIYRLVLTGYNISPGSFTTTGGQTTNVSSILSGTAMAFLAAGD